MSEEDVADYVMELEARVRELEAALGTARTALIHTRAFATLRSLQIQMDEALLHIDAVSAETPEGHTRMTDGITPSEPTEWLADLNAVSAETDAKMPDVEPGDYVLATKYHDGDPGDEWAIGFYARTFGGDRHIVNGSEGQPFRANGFRRVERITAQAGAWLLARKELIESGHASLWGWLEEAVSAETEDDT